MRMEGTSAHIDIAHRGRLASTASWLRKEIRAARPIVIFFFSGFMLVLMIAKLSLAQYSIEVSTVSRALIGALVAAKVTLILDETRIASAFARFPRVVPIGIKTFIYGLAVVILGTAERLFDIWRHSPSFAAAWTEFIEHASMHRLLAIALGTAYVFAMYFVLQEISRLMGPGAIRTMLFKTPPMAAASERTLS